MENSAAIEMVHVRVDLGGECILKDVSLRLEHGETMVIIGPSGAGKTVLIKTMAGIILPLSGHVYCEGEEWKNLKSEHKRKLAVKIGVQFQKTALFDSLSVFENVAFPLREHHPELKEEQVRGRVQECLESVNLNGNSDLLPHELSGGMRQRLAIARAIALNPSIVFYDDPTAGLDPINSDKMADLILDLHKKNESTLVVVTHDMARAYQLAGRIFVVVDQEVIETGNVEQTKNHKDPRVQQFIHGRLSGPLSAT